LKGGFFFLTELPERLTRELRMLFSNSSTVSGGSVNSPAVAKTSFQNPSEKIVEIDRTLDAKNKCEPLIDAGQAGELLELHPKTVKRLAARGILPGIRIGKLWRFRASSLDAWLKSQLHLSRHPCSDVKGEE
jgi:excisionase family DNA binding protein